jgi:hypothetical protein
LVQVPTGKEEEATESLLATGPIPVDMGDIGTSDEVLYAAAELGTQDKTTTTMLGDGTEVHYDASDVAVEHQSPTKVIGDGGITDKVFNASSGLGVEDKGAEETGTEVNSVAKDVATVAVGTSTKRQLRQHVDGHNDSALVVVAKRKLQKKKVHVEAPFDGTKDDVSKWKVLKKKLALKEEIMEIDESKSDNSGPNNLILDALVEFPNWINRGDRLDWILVSKFMDKQYDRHVAFFVDEETKQYPIYYGDFWNYNDKVFISHAVIDGYFWLLDQKFKDSQICFANCALWSRYISCINVSSEQQKKVVGKLLYPEDNFLYIPIHIGGNHWCLAQIYIPGRSITFVDPLDQFRKKSCKQYTDHLSIAFGFDSTWNIIDHYNDRSIQCQNDSHSCAFFTCWYSHQLAMNDSIGVWMVDWESRLRTICRDIMTSLVERVIIFSH